MAPHVLGDEQGFVVVEGQGEVPVLADDEGHVEPTVVKDLGHLHPDQAAPNHHRPLALAGLPVEALEVAEGDEVVKAGAGRARPRSLPAP